MQFPVRLTITAVPTKVEHRERDKVKSVTIPGAWRRVADMIGKQIKAGGAVQLEHRVVNIPKRLKTDWGSVPLSGAYITEVADVKFVP